jgi:integrase/recombinase XerD
VTVLIPEHRELDTPSPDIAAEMFLLRFSNNTAAAYRNDLKVWGRWLNELGISPFDADRNTIQLWVKGMQGRAPATVARRLACLSSFYTYLEQEGLVERSPLAGVRRPKGSGRPVSGLDRHELRSLLRAAKAEGHMEHALVLLMSLNGLRVASVVALNFDDLGQERGYRVVTVKGKGGKVQRLPLADVTWQAVRQLIEEREEDEQQAVAIIHGSGASGDGTGAGSRRDDPPRGLGEVGCRDLLRDEGAGHSPAARIPGGRALFTSPTGERLTRWQAFRIVRRLAAQAGVREISPHSLRSAFITLSREAGAPLEDVQDACGHASPVTTRSYDRARYMLERNPTHVLATFIGEDR